MAFSGFVNVLVVLVSWIYINWYIILVECFLAGLSIAIAINVKKAKEDRSDPLTWPFWFLLFVSICMYIWDVIQPAENTCEDYPIMCTTSEIVFSLVNAVMLFFTIRQYRKFRALGVPNRPEGYHRLLKKEEGQSIDPY